MIDDARLRRTEMDGWISAMHMYVLTLSFVACAMNPNTALATASNATTTHRMVITLLLAMANTLDLSLICKHDVEN